MFDAIRRALTGRREPWTEGPVALWWVRYLDPDYAIYDREREAAERAWGIEDGGGAVVLGIQFPDGRLVGRDNWPLLAEVTAIFEAEIEQDRVARAARPPKPKRQIRDPFRNRPLDVDPDEPSWLGAPGEQGR